MQKISEDFKPSHRIYSLAAERGIPIEFVDECVTEFIFYWTEGKGKGTRRKSWQQSFWNWVKNGWSFKMKQEKKTVRTMPLANKEWEAPVIEKSKSTMSLRERLRQG